MDFILENPAIGEYDEALAPHGKISAPPNLIASIEETKGLVVNK